MVAAAGGTDVLLAYPIVGPNLGRLARLVRHYPGDHVPGHRRRPRLGPGPLGRAARARPAAARPGRPGRRDGPDRDRAGRRGRRASTSWSTALPNLEPDGLHAYDGHIHDFDPDGRAPVRRGRGSSGPRAPRPAARRRACPSPGSSWGGRRPSRSTPRSTTPGVECSPGTCVLHDAGYATRYPDLPFTPAAVLLTRVISRPRPGRLCLDLGHKAVAADPVGARADPPRTARRDPRRPERGTPRRRHPGRRRVPPGHAPPGLPDPHLPDLCPAPAGLRRRGRA